MLQQPHRDLLGIRDDLATPAAWKCIQEMATGDPAAPLTQHARQTLERRNR